jgi:primosomal protein N' (replication factor Y)
MFAEIILARVTPRLDKVYHYSIPAEIADKLDIGCQVMVPFGRSKCVGYVVGMVEKSEVKGIKDIEKILSPFPLFTRASVELAKWISEYYDSFFITALRLVMPPGTLKIEQRALKKKLRKPLYEMRDGRREVSDLSHLAPRTSKFILTEEQQKALRVITGDIELKTHGTSLLYGITGSGKTEVYLRAAEYAIQHGGSALILIPEVGLTPQMVERAANRFGEKLAVYYSNMPEKDRQSVWAAVVSGETSVVLGTRSAIFLPMKNLKLIVLDEEYENTYKSDQSPRYHTREVALNIAAREKAAVVFGSATPSVETYYHAKQGEYKLLTLSKRIDDRPLPPVKVIDMRKELKEKNFNVLSRKLQEEIRNVYNRKEQSILFINRRGYFSFVMCRACGHVIQCPNCTTSLIYYMNDKKLRCNHCNFTADAATICPKCQSTQIKYFGGGTQKIEQEVARLVPKARILRLDRDSVNKKGSYENIIRSFIAGSADILIGTQMVTKGLDIASVTLVGVVAADIGLNAPDFRAAEHTFQLLTQVAGRAGRHKLAGEVVVQTYDPEHYAIKFASKHDYAGFYGHEIEVRKELEFPPFSKLINIIISAGSEDDGRQVGEDLVRFLEGRLGKAAEVFGPAVAPIAKLKDMHRFQVMLKGQDIGAMRKAVVDSSKAIVKLGRARIMVDIDPYNML